MSWLLYVPSIVASAMLFCLTGSPLGGFMYVEAWAIAWGKPLPFSDEASAAFPPSAAVSCSGATVPGPSSNGPGEALSPAAEWRHRGIQLRAAAEMQAAVAEANVDREVA